MDQFFISFGTTFGTILGPKKCGFRGTHFSRFFGVAPNGPREAVWSRFWCHLGPSWPHLGAILDHPKPIWAHLAAICL